ncbi:nuclear transport factor 2 family protein [Sphingomonas sp. TZW2008]|uniref:YybH family protein n=1 Tax=Sphingomonas sp. TZW2008 TaxID=1917973 RepID=UPI000A269998|nr:nuclear transport factor 2 family protein [Sphingomonas sp. TZW2008]
MTVDIARYNADWLAAWTAKDVPALLGFYAPDCRYFDPQTAAGITGHDALRTYLTGLFAATPPMTYTPDETWPIPGGFCGRWYCDVADGGGRLRGFDMVLLDGDRIAHNEVYVHQLPQD